VHLDSPAEDESIAFLHQEVERACPILNLLLNPQSIEGTIVRESGANVLEPMVAA
jgi:hypothetical protein